MEKKIGSEILLFRGGSGSCVQQIFNFFGLIDFLIRMTNIKYLLLKDTSRLAVRYTGKLLKVRSKINYSQNYGIRMY